MNCGRFGRWLDAERPARDAAVALAHSSGCAGCAAALRSASEIEAELAGFAPPAPAAFTDRVMARVAAVERANVAVQALPAPFDWWVRAASEPATALALLVAGLVLWRGDALPRVAAPAALRLAGAIAGLGVPHPALFDRPGLPLALALAVTPVMLWVSWRLYRTAERACGARIQNDRWVFGR